MDESGDWITMKLDGIRYLEKPPLPYWLDASFYWMFGQNTFATHLPNALAILGLAWLAWMWVLRGWGRRAGLYAALGVLTSIGPFLFTRFAIPVVLIGAAPTAILRICPPSGTTSPGSATSWSPLRWEGYLRAIARSWRSLPSRSMSTARCACMRRLPRTRCLSISWPWPDRRTQRVVPVSARHYPDEPPYSAWPYDELRRVVADSRATKKVVILDCCFSGRALADQAGDEETILGQVGIEGTYLLTATAANAAALAPPGEQYTAFTGALIGLLNKGIPGGPELLTFGQIYPRLRYTLTSRQLPRPRQQGSDTIADLALTRNLAYTGTGRDRDFNERFAAIKTQLGDAQPAVRLAGVHAMAGLTDDWEENRRAAVDVLCAYLRRPTIRTRATTLTRRNGSLTGRTGKTSRRRGLRRW